MDLGVKNTKLQAIKCPNCNAEITADLTDKKQVFCTYCGNAIYIDEEKKEFTYTKRIEKNIHKRYTDDAQVITAINEGKKGKHGFIAIVILILAFIIYCIVDSIISEVSYNSEIKRENKQRREAIQAGLISAGYSSDWIDKDYHAAVAHFESAGFKNIETIDLEDSGLKVWTNETVASISIEGKSHFNDEDYFSPDSTVYISYH